MDIAAKDTLEVLPGEVDFFAPFLESNILLNEINEAFAPIATIQANTAIEFEVTGKDKHYLDLNDSYMTVRAKMTIADGVTAPGAHAVGPVNLPLHSMFAEVSAQLNGKETSELTHLYPYRAYMETLLNYNKQVQDTRLQAEGWSKDTTGSMGIADPQGANVGLVAREIVWNAGRTTELVGRPHLDIFQQGRLIPPKVNLHLKLIPAADNFVIMSNAQNPAFRVVIVSVQLTIRMKQLVSEAELAHRELVVHRPMKLPYSRIQMNERHITLGLQNISFDNLFTGVLPDLVVVGMVHQDHFAGAYAHNPFNFQNFGVTRMELKRNGISVPREGYKPDFTVNSSKYMKAYRTFLDQLGYNKGSDCLDITPGEWATGFNLYVFKITDGPIGSGTESPRSRALSGTARLDIDFAAPTVNVIKVIILSQSLGLIEIDEFTNVVVQ